MAFCLTAPSHYLNQCWLIVKGVLWHWPKSMLTLCLEFTLSNFLPHLPGENELRLLKGSVWKTFNSMLPKCFLVRSLKHWVFTITYTIANVAVPNRRTSAAQWLGVWVDFQCDSHWLRNKYYPEYDWTLEMCMSRERQALVGLHFCSKLPLSTVQSHFTTVCIHQNA